MGATMAEIYRVIKAWPIEEFPSDPCPDHLRTLNRISPPGIRYVPEYARGGADRIEVQEYVTDRDTENDRSQTVERDHTQDAGGPGAIY